MIDIPINIVSQRLLFEDKNRYIIYFDINSDDMIKLSPHDIKRLLVNRVEKIDAESIKKEWQSYIK